MKKHLFNKSLRVLLLTNAFILFAGAMLGPIYAIFVEDIGGHVLEAGLAGAVFALAAGITSLFSGYVADKMKNRVLIVVIGYMVMGAGFLFYNWVNSIATLFLAQIVIGIGEALYSPAFDLVYTRHLDKGKAGKQWGGWESMNYFTVALGAGFGGWLAYRWGFTPLFVIMSGLCLISSLYLLLLPKKLF
jgi:MFS family permease